MDSIISGAYDMHIHVAPDVMPRKLDFIAEAERCRDAGMAGYVIKSHYFPSAPWAQVANERVPEVHTVGSIVLNNAVGGLNPYAVDLAGRDGAKVCWFPTVDTVASIATTEHVEEGGRRPFWLDVLLSIKESGMELKPVKLIDDNDHVVDAVYDVLDVIKRYDMILATGHISVRECKAVIKAAKERGVDKIICTHVDSQLCFWDIDDQLEYVNKYGVYMEHCGHSLDSGKVTPEVLYEQIKAVGFDHIILSTDGGQKKSDYPDEVLLRFCNWMLEKGFSEEDVRKAIVHNPAQLLGF